MSEYKYYGNVDFSELEGEVITEIDGDVNSEELYFRTESGKEFIMSHIQDCCESVSIEDIDGDLKSLIGQKVISAYESQSRADGEKKYPEDEYPAESATWTFYTIRTNKDSLTIRWYGSSNGYYSENADFRRLK